MYNVSGYTQSGTLSYTHDTGKRITDFMVESKGTWQRHICSEVLWFLGYNTTHS